MAQKDNVGIHFFSFPALSIKDVQNISFQEIYKDSSIPEPKFRRDSEKLPGTLRNSEELKGTLSSLLLSNLRPLHGPVKSE